MEKPRSLRIAASSIVLICIFLAAGNVFAARSKSEVDLLVLILVLSGIIIATILFMRADVLDNSVMIKSKLLQIMAACVIIFALLLASGIVCFNIFVAPLTFVVNLFFVAVVLLNILQAFALLRWAKVSPTRQP